LPKERRKPRVFENVKSLTFTLGKEAPYVAYIHYDSPRSADVVPCDSALVEGKFKARWAYGSMVVDFKKPEKCSYDEVEKRAVCVLADV